MPRHAKHIDHYPGDQDMPENSDDDDQPLSKLSQAVLATCLLNEARASPSGSLENQPPSKSSKNKGKAKHSQVTDLELKENKRSTESGAGISNDESALNESLASAGNRIVTMTGTIRRGQKANELVQVQLELSEAELNRLNKSLASDEEDPRPESIWGLKKGLHILILTFFFIPFSFLMSLCVTFYVGTVTWYNIYLYLSEERTIWHRIFICPFLILFYPLLIIVVSVSMAAFASCVQVSWYYKTWCREIRDYEKGFFGWLCNKLNIAECAPYQVVVLDDQPDCANEQLRPSGSS